MRGWEGYGSSTVASSVPLHAWDTRTTRRARIQSRVSMGSREGERRGKMGRIDLSTAQSLSSPRKRVASNSSHPVVSRVARIPA